MRFQRVISIVGAYLMCLIISLAADIHMYVYSAVIEFYVAYVI